MKQCPFSDKDIDSIIPFDCAVIVHPPKRKRGNYDETASNENLCMCSMSCLIAHLYSTKGNDDINRCPVCFNSSVESIYDGVSHSLLLQCNNESNLTDDNQDDRDKNVLMGAYDVVSFKFNKHAFHLTVLKQTIVKKEGGSILETCMTWVKHIFSNIFRYGNRHDGPMKTTDTDHSFLHVHSLAQERIGHVLGIDSKQNMKILHKGKVIYPISSNTKNLGLEETRNIFSSDQISQHLIDVSNQDRKLNKLSLVVMGTRKDDMIIEKTTLNHGNNVLFRMLMTNRRSFCYVSIIIIIIAGGSRLFWKNRLPTESTIMIDNEISSVIEL